MKHSALLSFALGAGWLLSPESLVIAGNSAGNMGWFTLPVLTIAALLLGSSGKLLKHPQLPNHAGRELEILTNLTGTIPAVSLILVSCIPLTILAATALLVTSGYTFNEVFLYWFPNFGFSFLLLGLLTALQFFPDKIVFKAQVVFVSIAVLGLSFLALSGISAGGKPVTEALQQPADFSSTSSAVLLLLFAGSTLTTNSKRPFLIPITGCVILGLWISVSLLYVNPERLASSTIPYMTAARKVMGDPGRQIMGVVVISGTCAALTTLLILCKQMLGNCIQTNAGKALLSAKQQRWLFPPLVALATGVLMAKGLAGDELLEILLHGALILWLMYYSLLCLSALLVVKKQTGSIPLGGALSTTFLLAAFLTLSINNQHRTEILLFILSMLGTGGFIATIWFFMNKQAATKTVTQQMENIV